MPTNGENPEVQDDEREVDPWAKAFAEVAAKAEGTAQADERESGDAAGEAGGDDGNQVSEGDVGLDEGDDGGAGAGPVDADPEDGESPIAEASFTEEEVEEQIKEMEESIKRQAMNEVAQKLIDGNIMRNERGQLGAYLEHPSITKRDEDGTPHFYNPETGKEFTGDNPRAQARAWVKDYNEELTEVFEREATKRMAELNKQKAPIIQTLRFAPKYDKLDPVRQRLLDSIIEDYEIEDEDGNVIGYSCDLDKALTAVNRQISNLQGQYGKQPRTEDESKPSGPALDMKTGASQSSSGKPPEFKSMAEAMEWQQDQILNKRRK